MKLFKTIRCLLTLAALALWVSGCATRDVNPSQARANTGYVDFYVDSSGELSWQVERFEVGSQSFKRVFSDLEPPPGRALRLAFPPGHHRLRVLFLNCFLREPALVEVEVKDGLITPVHFILTADDAGLMDRKEQRTGGTMKGRYGRSTKIRSEETVIFRVSAEAETPMPYRTKEHITYAQ